ncbi:hypothetical protein FACS1894199_10210 [Bacteroidia bacterium]|nr:hypothetical protein FACS1894199_10210 [Bacteroidia bacterium]
MKKVWLKKNTTYQIGIHKIQIPSSARLPIYQKLHPLYDRFLPVLAKNLNTDGTIIDVGANVGDSLAAMIQQCNNSFICIEPSNFFFEYLEKNVQNLKSENTNPIKLFKSLVGTKTFEGKLKDVRGSTASLVVSEHEKNRDGVQYSTIKKLDDIVQNHKDVILLKCDVDGFDFDVIESAKNILSASEPILFFENQIDNDFQYQGFNKLYDFLAERGYHNLYIFDNFGNIVVEKADYHTLKNFNAYLYSMTKYHATRTFCYTDILVSTDKNTSIIARAIEDYKSNWVKR